MTDLLVRREKKNDVFLPWLIRKVESLHGTVTFQMQCAPAFNYCRDEHTAEVSVCRTLLRPDCRRLVI